MINRGALCVHGASLAALRPKHPEAPPHSVAASMTYDIEPRDMQC